MQLSGFNAWRRDAHSFVQGATFGMGSLVESTHIGVSSAHTSAMH